MVSAELPARFTAPEEGPGDGTGSDASGSARGLAPVTGVGLTEPPLMLTPPPTWMLPALTWPPLSTSAEEELESTMTRPGVVMLALLRVTSSAPRAAESRTITEPRTVTFEPVAVALARKLLSPPYEATIVWVPGGRSFTVTEAVPPLSVGVPRVFPVVASTKVTVPVGVPLPGALAVTVAVIVTAWPKSAVLGPATTVVVASLLTVSAVEASEADRKSGSLLT